MEDTLGEVNASLQNENTYDLVCLGFHNTSGTCYLSVTLNCILTMEVTRRAFMNLPDPGSPDYHIPNDTMTALIHFFFLHRRRPKIHHRSRRLLILKQLDRIQNWIHWEIPELPNHFQGSGGSSARALQFILDRLRQEGYVKGLLEDVRGIYTTRVTCKACGYDHKKLSSEMMVSFSSELDKFQFFQYLTDHEAVANKELYNAQQEGGGNNNITRFLSVQDIFNFAERFSYTEQQGQLLDRHRHDISKFKNASCGAYDIRFRTTFNQFPLNLIVDIDYMRAQFRGCIIIDEFIDLSQLAESETSATVNAKYKLVVVGDVLADNIPHAISYVRASKYANEIYCPDHPSVDNNIARENMWYKVDNSDVELVSFSKVLEGMQEHNLLIYEKEQRLSTVQNKKKQSQMNTQTR